MLSATTIRTEIVDKVADAEMNPEAGLTGACRGSSYFRML
jgi:hypothetical protein